MAKQLLSDHAFYATNVYAKDITTTAIYSSYVRMYHESL